VSRVRRGTGSTASEAARLPGIGAPDTPARAVAGSARQDWFWLWDVYYLAGGAVVIALVLDPVHPPFERFVAAGCVVAMLAWYWLVGRPAILAGNQGRPGWVFVAGLLGVIALAVWALPMTAYALFIACPMAFMALPLRGALVAVLALNAVPVGVAGLRGLDKLQPSVTTAVLGLAFALLAGTYLDRTIRINQERADLIAELTTSRSEVERLSLEAGAAAERSRLAGDIHDTLAQGFTSVITLCQAAQAALDSDRSRAHEHLDLAVRTARENLAEARALVAALTPAALDDSSLEDALARLVNAFRAEAGVTAALEITGLAGRLCTRAEVVLLRTAQEALTNVRRHARASTVRVQLAYSADAVVLTVADDGAGFDATAPHHGYGLVGMAARAETLGAVLGVDTAVGRGTTVRLEVPR
jgi:signal transduction histidine kinase